ncbi:MAG TPA: 30S ribosomal protein S12 methylthiotransferase RimO [Firmicutes bacterium]|nr:30S ribosomal protein S12 methylthiotransferase RimO [Bacillota bacterium]
MEEGPLNVGMVSLGCAKNLVDAEIMLGLLKEAGYNIVANEQEADVLIVNTCGFIEPAKEEAIDTILELARWKEAGNCKALVVTGCLSQRYGRELLDEMPEIDAVVGTGEFNGIAGIVDRVLSGERVFAVGVPEFLYDHRMPRLLSTPGHVAYLKIAEGCENRCSYCVIPAIRGRFRSRTMESVIEEARVLVDRGVKELILIAQDTTRYGLDLYGKPSLASLLRKLARIDGLTWARFLYTHPTGFTDELIETVATESKICKYIDIPLQHIDGEILRRMNRKPGPREIEDLIARLKRDIPEVTLRSSFIVGFPGETEAAFSRLLDFIRDTRFDRIGVFKYSPEEGTAAAEMPGSVPEDIKEERYRRVMELARRISREKNEGKVGRVLDVLIDGRAPESELLTVGRSQAEAPEVDGLIYIGNDRPPAGEIRKVKITQAGDYDLVGEVIAGGRGDRHGSTD